MPTDQPPAGQAPLEGPPSEPAPVPVKKSRKPRAKKTPKVKPDDRPVDIPDDHPALQAAPDPKIDAVAAAEEISKNVEVRSAKLTWPEFEAQVMSARNQPKPEYVPPVPTARQAEKTRLEMEAGAKRTAYFQEQERLRQQIPPDPSDAPLPTPVFRPKDFVPKHGSKDPGISSQNIK